MIGKLSKMVCINDISINNFNYLANTIYLYRACLFVAGDISQYGIYGSDAKSFIGYLPPIKVREYFMPFGEWQAELDKVDVMFELILGV